MQVPIGCKSAYAGSRSGHAGGTASIANFAIRTCGGWHGLPPSELANSNDLAFLSMTGYLPAAGPRSRQDCRLLPGECTRLIAFDPQARSCDKSLH